MIEISKYQRIRFYFKNRYNECYYIGNDATCSVLVGETRQQESKHKEWNINNDQNTISGTVE